MQFESNGKLIYGPGVKAAILIDSELIRYYLKAIPAYYYARSQMYPGHITVVRLRIEQPLMDNWGLDEGSKFNFVYDNEIKFDGRYFYLDSWSDMIGDLREKLGLSRYRVGFNSYHITIGNVKKSMGNLL